MSVFSMFKRSRQAAKEHSAKKAELEKKEEAKVPYKHIPKHAAIDAISAGPATWRETDRPKILAQNRRRSAMTANNVGMGGMMTPVHQGMHSGMPRVNSSLSHVSYPSTYASPVRQVPRAYSYSSMPPGWSHNGGELSYFPVDAASLSVKGKEVERVLVDSGRASRSSSKASAVRSPLEALVHQRGRAPAMSSARSSSNSDSSQDDLEMKPVVRPVSYIPQATSPPSPRRPLSDTDSLHRLHPNHARRISDPNQYGAPAKTAFVPSRYSPSRDTSSTSLAAIGIPPIPALPPKQIGNAISTPAPVASSAASTSSSVTVVPVASSTSLAAKIANPASKVIVEDLVSTTEAVEIQVPVGTAITTSPNKNRRPSKNTRFTELETINSDLSASAEPTSSTKEQTSGRMRPFSMVSALPTSFDEASLPGPQEIVLPPPKTGKAPKLVKKNRWSIRGSKNTAVAV
ncbi:hypothetical protein B0T17DRAFT_613860 [Bombardia bombarda]|uniref:Uncharacterized protein n=1 Tax=Bombardia bombarda TaxID=252184 RepID=A0AA39XNE7_9PEZI|nr:hypothetical protein B0T17DRAFT_613860 [Bombardia bombarda]